MKKINKGSKNQLGALITLAVVAVWGIWIFWFHLTRPMGLAYIEIIFLSVLVPIYLILLPFYWFRVRWSYISGILVLLGLFVGLLKTTLEYSLFFSISTYNLLTVGVYLVALGCIYFSIRSYMELPSGNKVKSTVGILGFLSLSTLAVFLVSNNYMAVENYMLKQVIQGVQARTEDIENLDDKIEALMAEGDMNSIAVAIILNDEIQWIQSYGEEPDLHKTYNIGSVTKTFTATAILQLYERGLIDLDDDVNEYLSFNVRHPDYPDVPITFRMLLANRSCLAHNNEMYFSYVMHPELIKWGLKNRGWARLGDLESISYADFMAGYLEPDSPYFQPENWWDCKPGTEFVYSTPGFDLLGYLVEQVSNQSYSDYLQENIFGPLEMTDTTTTPLDYPEQMAIPYERWYGVLAKTNVELPLTQRRRIGGGGLYSTAADLSNFLIAHMNHGEFDGYQLLQPETVALMHSTVSDSNADFMGVGYGYGWGLFQEEPRQLWDITYQPRGMGGHGGQDWGYSSAMYMVEAEGGAYGYVVLMNIGTVESSEDPWTFSIKINIQDLILEEAHRLGRASSNQLKN
jgi:CubicO group peptidase (beta-lactamase class C family)